MKKKNSRTRAFKFPVSILIGSRPLNILRVLNGYRVDFRYYPKFVLTFFVSLVFEIINLPERLVYNKKKKSLRIEEPPVFIIGFWRSGTTLLHSLMCQDPGAGYVTTFQGVFPNLVLTQKKWMKALTNSILPKKRPFDAYPMDMDFPQEEDFAMMSLQPSSIYKFFYFPRNFNDIYKKELHFERLTDFQRERWKSKYTTLMNKALLNTGGKRYIAKNPCNIFRIRTLTQLFPDARFIFIYRNPYYVVESLTQFVNKILPGSELQHLDGGIKRESFARLYKDSLNEYMIAKETIVPGNLIEIRYEEFKERPLEIIRDIYKEFNIQGIDEALPLVESYLGKNNPGTRKSYEIPEETYRLVNEHAEDIVVKFGYKIVKFPE